MAMTGTAMRFRGPLAESYAAAVCLVVFALIPYLALSSAFTPLMPILSKSLHLSDQALSLTTGMANAAYAFGTVLAVQFAVHLSGVTKGSDALVLIGSGLVGLGVGASVSPALFIAGFSLLSTRLQRVFALVELLRGVAAFMVAPIILHIAMTVGSSPSDGIGPATWVCFAIAAGGGLLAIVLFVAGRARLQRPDLESWDAGEKPAWYSPPLLAGLRRQRRSPTTAGAHG
jgi:hypothetical protein